MEKRAIERHKKFIDQMMARLIRMTQKHPDPDMLIDRLHHRVSNRVAHDRRLDDADRVNLMEYLTQRLEEVQDAKGSTETDSPQI